MLPQSLEELMEKYKVTKHPRFGNSIIISKDDFKHEILSLGILTKICKLRRTHLDRIYILPATFNVPKKFMKGYVEPKLVTVQKKKKAGKHWSDKEDKLLIDICSDPKVKRLEVYDLYNILKKSLWPKRTENSVLNHVNVLMRKGKILNKYGNKHGQSLDKDAVQGHPIMEKPKEPTFKELVYKLFADPKFENCSITICNGEVSYSRIYQEK